MANITVDNTFNQTAQTAMQQIAMQQIKKKKYPDSLHGYTGNLLMVAINYDKKSKKHQCIIEKIIQ